MKINRLISVIFLFLSLGYSMTDHIWGNLYDLSGYYDIHVNTEISSPYGKTFYDGQSDSIESFHVRRHSDQSIIQTDSAIELIKMFYNRQRLLGYGASGNTGGNFAWNTEDGLVADVFVGEEVQYRDLTNDGDPYSYWVPRFFDQPRFLGIGSPYYEAFIEKEHELDGFSNFGTRKQMWKKILGQVVFFEQRDPDASAIYSSISFFDNIYNSFQTIDEQTKYLGDIAELSDEEHLNFYLELLRKMTVPQRKKIIKSLFLDINDDELEELSKLTSTKFEKIVNKIDKVAKPLRKVALVLKALNFTLTGIELWYASLAYKLTIDNSIQRFSSLEKIAQSSNDQALKEATTEVYNDLLTYSQDVTFKSYCTQVEYHITEFLGLTTQEIATKAVVSILNWQIGLIAAIIIEAADNVEEFEEEVKYMSLSLTLERMAFKEFNNNLNILNTSNEYEMINHLCWINDIRFISAKLFYDYFNKRLDDHGILHITLWESDATVAYREYTKAGSDMVFGFWQTYSPTDFFIKKELGWISSKVIDEIPEVVTSTLNTGKVTPNVGDVNTNFEFSAIYKGDAAPTDIKLFLDGISYPMTTSESNWLNGVTYTFNKNDLSKGQHSFYYTATSASGKNLRYPQSGDIEFTVNESSKDWEVLVHWYETKILNPSKIKPGDNININVNVQNTGMYEYKNLTVYTELKNSIGTTIANNSYTISSLPASSNLDQTVTIIFPSNSSDGTYNINCYITPTLDTDWSNNVHTMGFMIGETVDSDVYEVQESRWVDATTFDELKVFNPNNLQFELSGWTSSEMIYYDNNSDRDKLSQYEINFHESRSIFVACNYVGSSNVMFEYGFETANNIPRIVNGSVSGSRGETVNFEAFAPSGRTFNWNTGNYYIYSSNGANLKQWFKDVNEIGDTRDHVNFEFKIPNDAPLGYQTIYLKIEYDDNSEPYHIVMLKIKVVPPTPKITGLSSNSFSADDTLHINGNNLSTSGTVNFGDSTCSNANILSWSNTQISLIVPENLVDGNLYIQNSQGISNSVSYHITSKSGAPTLVQNIPNQISIAGDTLFISDLTTNFSDPNNQPLTFTASFNVKQGTDTALTIMEDSLSINKLYVHSIDNNDGLYTISITASDGDKSTTHEFDVTVQDINDAPVLLETFAQTINEDFKLKIDTSMVTATDIEGDILSVLIGNGDNFTFISDTIIPTPDFYGKLYVPICVTDGEDSSAFRNIIVNVTPINDPPFVKTPIGSISIDSGDSFIHSIPKHHFEDVDNINIEVTMTTPPIGVTCVDSIIEGSIDSVGTYIIIFTATDSMGACASDTFKIIVDKPTAISLAGENSSPIDTFIVAPNPVSVTADNVKLFIPEKYSGNKAKISVFDYNGDELDFQEIMLKGNEYYIWDLRNSNGKKVTSGLYVAVLRIINKDGTEITKKVNIGIKSKSSK